MKYVPVFELFRRVVLKQCFLFEKVRSRIGGTEVCIF